MSASRIYQQLKNIYHFFQAHLWRIFYNFPERGLKLYGVTGTNGKTTTCILLGNILQTEHGKEKVGLLTTIVFWLGQEEIVNETKMTTMKSRDIFKNLAVMKKRGVTHVVLEITSHALDQLRLAGLTLEGAIITNIAREHLDYHKTMTAYAAAKEKIVSYLKPDAVLVGKADDQFVSGILQKAQYTKHKTQTFTAEEARRIQTSLPGEFNQENVLAAMKLARAVGISEEAIQKGIQAVKQVPGRMEYVDAPQGFRVVIDYAVTPDALEKLYQHVRAQASGKIYAVLGAAGLRDRGKRPDMAKVVAQYVDELVLTREDPWTEPEEQIFQDLEKGLENTKIPWQKIIARREALAYFIKKAQLGDVIVVTGKGAERGMAIGKKIIPWHERTVVEELISEL